MGGEWTGNRDEGEALRFDIECDLLCTASADGRFLSLNRAWEEKLGWTREELMGAPFLDFVHPEDREATIEVAARVTEPDVHVVDFENRYATKDGDWCWLRWTSRSDGENCFAVAFDITAEKRREEELRLALEQARLLAYAQPIVNGANGEVVQEELLARLDRRTDGIQVAGEFLPEAERSGLITIIDRFMLQSGLSHARHGRAMEVNLSARTMADEGATREILDAVEKAQLAPGMLVFEITETALLRNVEIARDFAERLADLGCGLALDDFGTGFGSLTYLRDLPIRFIKIDRRFVAGMTENTKDRALVRGVVAIAREFGLDTVAEGVEDQFTLEALQECGVDFVQGYYFGRPAPIGEPEDPIAGAT